MDDQERPHLEVLQHDPAAPAWAPIADEEDTPVRGEADGNIRGVLAILEWPEEATEPAAIYIASGDTPGELAGLVAYVLEEQPQTRDDPAQLAAELVEQVASAGLPYRLSATEPAFDGRIIQVDPEARTVALFSAGSAGQPGRRWRSWSFEEVTTSSEWCRAFEAC